jgi:hypothetical protein
MQSLPETALDLSVGAAVVGGRVLRGLADRSVVPAARACGRSAQLVWAAVPEPVAARVRLGASYLVQTGRETRASVGEDSASMVTTLSVRLAETEMAQTVVMSVVSQALDDVLEQVLPATLEAMESPDVVAQTDAVMTEMLMRVMPGVLENTLPTSMVRVTTRAPVDFVPLLRAAARLDR